MATAQARSRGQGGEVKTKILEWFAMGRIGASSKAMACKLAGFEGDNSHPVDPDDFNRCLLFLKTVPEAREHMDKISSLSESWRVLVKHWDEIESLFLREVGLNWSKGRSAPITYELMNKLLKRV